MRSRAKQTGWAWVLLLLAGSAGAQTPLPDLNSSQTTQPTSSPTTEMAATAHGPVDVRPFLVTTPDNHLLGDWWGARTELERMGIKPTLTFEVDNAANPTGGRSQGITESSNLGLDVLFDLEKVAGIEGGGFEVQMSERFGNSLSADYIGNIFTTQQDFGGETFRIVDVAYQQKLFDDRLEFRVGRVATGDDFFVSQYDYLFMQNAFDGNPVGIFFNAPGMTAYPNATWGALVKVHPTPRSYVMVGGYNGDSTIRGNIHHGIDTSLDGPAFLICEAGHLLNQLPGDAGLPGNFKAGFWFDNTLFQQFGSTDNQRGSSGFYGLFDQVLVRYGGNQSNRGLGVFGSVLFSNDPSVAQLPFFFTAGVAARGVFAGRGEDAIGLAVVYGHFSDDLQDAQTQAIQSGIVGGVKDYELATELTYRFYLLNHSTFLQPDLQYINRPGGTGRYADALVIGLRFGVNF